MNQDQIETRIAEIDKMFDDAKGWGSWMSEASSERRGLVRQIKSAFGIVVPDKHVLKTASGHISD